MALITNDLRKKCAIVTGAGKGIGRAIALGLADCGVNTVLASRTGDDLQVLKKEIEAKGGHALAVPTDVSTQGDVKNLVSQAVGAFGGVNIIINNAGVGKFGPLEHTSLETWDRIMAINARGPFLLCRECIPHLRKHDRSFIINIGSVVSVKGYINQAAYSASKHALMGMSKALAKEVQKDGIRVHMVCPGGVDTDMVGDARPDLDRSILIQPQEVADTVLFLLAQSGNACMDEIYIRRDSSMPWA